jgi:hypothetical protein
MTEKFSLRRSFSDFEGSDWVEIQDLELFKTLGLPDNIVSIFVDEFAVHNTELKSVWDFQDLWLSTSGLTYIPGKPEETVLIRECGDELTAYWINHPEDMQGWSAPYTALSYSLKYESASIMYHGGGSFFTIGKPFRFEGKLREAVLTKLCEEASAPLKIVKRDHPKYQEARRAELERIRNAV